MNKKLLLVLCAAVVLIVAFTVLGRGEKDYPSKDITILIPKAPGGGTDTSARSIMEFLKKQVPVNVVGVNKPEANGVVAMEEGARAKPDGYTLVMVVVEAAMLPHQGRMNVKVEDYSALCATIADPVALVVRADAPYQTLGEFVEYCRANPGKVQVGNAGTVSSTYMCAKVMADDLKLDIKHIPYSDGTGPALAALVGGHIDGVMSTPGNALPQVQSGQLKFLGLMNEQRMSLFPDVPTFKEEVGVDFSLLSWAVLCAPGKMPEKEMNYLIDAVTKVVNDPQFKDHQRSLGIEPVVIVGKDADEMMRKDSEIYRQLLTNS